MESSRQDGEILVRPLRADDASLLFRSVRSSISSLTYWLPWCHADYSLADAEAWVSHSLTAWRNRSDFPLGIFNVQDGALLGGTGLTKLDSIRSTANIGYWVAAPHCGFGVASRAAAAAAAIGFEDLGLSRLELAILPHNHASLRVAEKIGAVREGIFPDRIVFQGQPAPAVVYSLGAGR